MDIKKKVPAFTLMEVTIAMLIAAIAIGITYAAYHIVSGTYINYTRKQDRVATFTVVDQLLKKDFLLADQIIRSADGINIQDQQGTISYQFKDTYILRYQYALQTDTFKLQVKSPGFSFENNLAEEESPVDQLSFDTQLEGETIPLVYQKIYSAQTLFH